MKRTASRPTSSTTSRKRDEVPGPLRHFDRLAGAQQLHKLDELDVELGLAVAQRRHRRLHALDVAAVVGAPDVDQRAKAALDLGAVVGDVGGEIGVASRPISSAAGRRRRRTRSSGTGSARGPPSPRPARLSAAAGGLRRRRRARAAKRWSRRHAIGVACDQRALGEKHVVLDIERGEVAAHLRHHHLDRLGAHERQPRGLRLARQRAPYSAASAAPTGLR